MTKASEEVAAAASVVDHLAKAKAFLVDVDSTEHEPQTFDAYARAATAHALIAIAERLPATDQRRGVVQRIEHVIADDGPTIARVPEDT